ncbi:nicotinate-nucleotide adenylyltransferase, partial [Limosilactobacillus fermentum]
PVIWVDVPTVAISSSDIRARVKSGQSIRYMVPRAVEDYIKEHQLYID